MLTKRLTGYLLLVVDLALILFIVVRAGSTDIPPKAKSVRPLAVQPAPTVVRPRPDTLILSGFDMPHDVVNMYRQGGVLTRALDPGHATHGRMSLRFDKKAGDNIETALTHFPRDWQGYATLQFDLYNDSHSDGTIWVRVGSQFDSKRFYVKSQKYAHGFGLRPKWNTVSIPLEDIWSAFGRIPQRKSLHFNFPAGSGPHLYLDYLRLVR